MAGTMVIGDICQQDSDCLTQKCLESDLKSAAVNIKYCVCDTAEQCETKYKKSEPTEIWTCDKTLAPKSNNLPFCQSDKQGIKTPVSAAAETTAAATASTAPTTPTGKLVTLNPPKTVINIPGLAKWEKIEVIAGEMAEIPYIAQYIVSIYKYALVIASILATMMIMIGGIMYMSSAGVAERISTAKNIILGAIGGIILLLGSYFILATINPNLISPSSIGIQTIPLDNIIEGEYEYMASLNVSAMTGSGPSGNLPMYKQTDRKWACFPFTGDECSYQVRYDDGGKTKSLACGTNGYNVKFSGISAPPEKGIFACKFNNTEYPKNSGVNYCQWLENTYHISEMCKSPSVKNSAWCENNPYGKNNFVEYCKNVSATNSKGRATNLNTLQSSGCGTTSAAMVLTFYGITTTPPELAQWVQEHGIRSPSVGSSMPQTCCGLDKIGIKTSAKALGLDAQEWWKPKKNEPQMLSILSKNLPIIIHVKNQKPAKNCPFTKGGHFIVLKDYKNSKFTVHDPAHGKMNVTADDIWDKCVVVSGTYLYVPGHKGEYPVLSTSPDDEPGTSITSSGPCTEPDFSPFNRETGCLNTTRSCTPNDIKEVGNKYGNFHIITAPNSCARFSSRILRNSGCAIKGSGGISSLKGQLKTLGWKGLIVKGTAARKYNSQMPVGVLFTCNTGELQHVSISTGKGTDVESANPFDACQSTGCSNKASITCETTDTNIKNKCTYNFTQYIPKLNAIEGGPKKCKGGSKNQCVNKTTGSRIKGVTTIFFPVLDPANENQGCCKSNLINASMGITSSGVKTSQKTCVEGLFGTWTSGGSCTTLKDPVQITKYLKAQNVCNCWGSGC